MKSDKSSDNSVNSYKGVVGGDPHLREANRKRKIKVSFLCKRCGNTKTELINEGTVRRDIPCDVCRSDCRNAERLAKKGGAEDTLTVDPSVADNRGN